MKNKNIAITVVLLIVALGNFFRIVPVEGIRNVEFISILAIGILTGVLLTQIFLAFSNRK